MLEINDGFIDIYTRDTRHYYTDDWSDDGFGIRFHVNNDFEDCLYYIPWTNISRIVKRIRG